MMQHVARTLAIVIAFIAALVVSVVYPLYRVGVFAFALLLAACVVLYRNAVHAFVSVADSVARPRV